MRGLASRSNQKFFQNRLNIFKTIKETIAIIKGRDKRCDNKQTEQLLSKVLAKLDNIQTSFYKENSSFQELSKKCFDLQTHQQNTKAEYRQEINRKHAKIYSLQKKLKILKDNHNMETKKQMEEQQLEVMQV